jgi:hypothetical protein
VGGLAEKWESGMGWQGSGQGDISYTHRCMARGSHGLSKVSSGPVIPYPIPRAGGLLPFSTPLVTPCGTPIYPAAIHSQYRLRCFSLCNSGGSGKETSGQRRTAWDV